MDYHKNYQEYAKEWAEKHPAQAKGYVDIKKGKVITEIVFETGEQKKARKIMPSLRNTFAANRLPKKTTLYLKFPPSKHECKQNHT